MKHLTRKILATTCIAALAASLAFPGAVLADDTITTTTTTTTTTSPSPDNAVALTTRIFGTTLYDTAVEIAKTGWSSDTIPAGGRTVVLATGMRFPDALAGTVLAHQVDGPLLLTESKQLTPQVADELAALGTKKVYLLGGEAVLSPDIETALENKGYATQRLFGYDQYGTAAAIAREVASLSIATSDSSTNQVAGASSSNQGNSDSSSAEAFIVTGERFEDALSISSYAAAKGIPLLMTRSSKLPDDTIKALQDLGIQEVTIIGGTGIIKDSITQQLESLPNPVKVNDRLAGINQYATNLAILNNFNYHTSNIFVATGKKFPDALAGAALASKSNQPILLVPPANLSNDTTGYLSTHRTNGSGFTILGGVGAVSATIENIIRTGSSHPRISLQYMNGASLTSPLGMLNQLATIPSPASDYVDIVAPSWFSLSKSDGTITGSWDTTPDSYAQIVNGAHARNLKVLPSVSSSWASSAAIDSALAYASSRTKMVNQIVQRINDLNLDGIVIDYEFMGDKDGPNLTAFMQQLYTKLHPMNKLVIMAVMSITDPAKQPWNAELNYHDLSQTVDYLHIMTYDYSTSRPGPIAPVNWVQDVLNYAKSQGVDMHKVLMGIPYYGTDWWIDSSGNWHSQSRGLYTLHSTTPANDIDGAMDRYDLYKNSSETLIKRDAGQIPYFSYTNEQGQHTVYFDDQTSWSAKLALVNQYDLGGIGAWSLYWVNNPDTENIIFPLLKQYLR